VKEVPVHTKWIRRLSGIAVLAVAVTAIAADQDSKAQLPASTLEMAIEKDTAHLMNLFELAKTRKRMEGRIRANALLIATYAQMGLDGPKGEQMAAIRDQAIKVAEAAAKKDLAAAQKAAEQLAMPSGTGDKKPVNLAKAADVELHDVMDLFGGAVGGGMNIEKDIRTAKRTGPENAKSAELIGARSAALAMLYIDLLPELDAKKTKDEWIKWSKQARDQAAAIVHEAVKGDKADMELIKKQMGMLDATCTNCHNVFRDD
jgi:hypothetical protein